MQSCEGLHLLFAELKTVKSRTVPGKDFLGAMRIGVGDYQKGEDAMESRAQKAGELFMEGCNCAQAVFVTYADLYGFDSATAMRIAASFGAGMGRMREVCGAVSGMLLVAGMETGAIKGCDQEGKRRNYEVVQHLAARFKDEFGSISAGSCWGLIKNGLQKKSRKRCLV